MKVERTALPGVLILEPKVFGDARGFFMETWNRSRYAEAGLPGEFVQDNVSYSRHGVLRGLHYQSPRAHGKLVHVLEGEVFDVAVDVRVGSPTFGRWAGATLSAQNRRQLWIPPGFAHGFCVTGETALFCYKCTELYAPEHEGSILWNDPAIGIAWPLEHPTLSAKDAAAPPLAAVSPARLPTLTGER